MVSAVGNIKIKRRLLTGRVVSRPLDARRQAIYVEGLAVECTALLFTEVIGSGGALVSIARTVTNPMSGTVFAAELRSILEAIDCDLSLNSLTFK